MNEVLSAFERRMEIKSILLNSDVVSKRELAEIFSVSLVAITRDIAALSRFAPIGSYMGRYGGVYIIKDYSIHKSYLSKDEEKLLLKVLGSLSGKDEILMKAILFRYKMPSKK